MRELTQTEADLHDVIDELIVDYGSPGLHTFFSLLADAQHIADDFGLEFDELCELILCRGEA